MPLRPSFGGVIALIVVAGYIGFEIVSLKRLGYRMEPAYVLDEYAGAHFATVLCAEPEPTVRARFTKNFTHVKRRAMTDWEATNGEGKGQGNGDGKGDGKGEGNGEGNGEEKAEGTGGSNAAREEASREWLERQLAERQHEIDSLFETQGCDGPDMKRLLRLHTIRSRLNVG